MASESSDRPSVLLVEHDRGIIRLVERVLDPSCAIHLARTPDRARQWLASGRSADLLITDLYFGGPSGGEDVVRHVREERGEKDLPILVLSVYDSPDTRERLMGAGATAFVAKPFEPDRLRSVVDRMLTGHRP
jgi:CheY-like chemotaxis protein